MSRLSRPFPEQGKFPSARDYQDYIVRSLKELGVSSYSVAKKIPGNTNNNIVREIETGAKSNPTLRKMKQIFDVIEGLRADQAEGGVVAEAAE